MALNPLQRIFYTFAKNLSNRKWGSPSSFLRCKLLKSKYRAFFEEGFFVAMINFYGLLMSAPTITFDVM